MKEKMQSLEEMNQLSQISKAKSSELNEVKEILQQKTNEYDSLLQHYRDLEMHYHEKEQIVQGVKCKYEEYEVKINQLNEQLKIKDTEQQNLIEEINHLV